MSAQGGVQTLAWGCLPRGGVQVQAQGVGGVQAQARGCPGPGPRGRVCIPACTEADTPLQQTATAADGTHPTGMHSYIGMWVKYTK